MTYAKQWGSVHPGCLIVLLDQSGSMGGKFGGTQLGAGRKKCDMVATVVNNLLHEFIKTNTVGSEIKPRADIAVIGYGSRVGSALGGALATKSFVSLPELMANPVRIETRTRKEVSDEGTVLDIPTSFPIWVEPVTGSTTPMCQAHRHARSLAEQWATTHPDCYPPVVINISDGGSTDGDPTKAVQELRNVSTNDGDTLVFNCHITNLKDPSSQFPGDLSDVPKENHAKLLFSISSVIPDTSRAEIQKTGYTLPPNARGFIFNGDAASIRQMFVFGTIGAISIAPDR